MCYRVTETYDDKLYTDSTVTNMYDVIPFNVTLPEKIGNKFPILQLELDSDLRPNDYFKSGPFVIVSSKMKAILEIFNAEYEFFDVVITSDKITYPKSDYFFAHLLCAIDFINKKQSIYKPYDSNDAFIEKVERLIINERSLNGSPVAMLKNCFENITIYQDKLVEKLIKESVLGIEYEKLTSEI
ncbi:imm11 family protein [Cronobacter sakazakii]|uniref:imm11 family protein n=1 Tax=Cronobacter sakazakii TaxID=28141 RepID=UPI000CFC584D|nr:DUF1629 domain-containing protein [Cronobacter sakazakii]ELY2651593.1 hypothetical protein [Cronobacter sakazakii]ELY2688670.1 hypothetical protein [Cronobacter sakazakii]ELY4372962.1 hypothetical protein [Cronobacter sakazakii]EME1906081.1 hypothetical protein [Cronobacter sakazakii]MDK1249908.1 hypothetical protein [Cronobacter sakazakii]